MRIFVLLFTCLVLLHSTHTNASSFSAVNYIRSCMADTLSPPAQQKCAGFFYGLISKKQALLASDSKGDGLVERAINSRTPSKNYGAITKRKMGVEEVCLPLDLDYQDFKTVIDSYHSNMKQATISVESITKALAKKYSC
jgi:hypothetical protein